MEAVYEEKNRGLDNDGRRVFEKLFAELFKKHNYGLQTTIGTIEHLKNPSLVEIRKYCYFRRVREICDRHQVLFIADEVLVGAGRTGTWSAIEQYGVVPDIMTFGKGITGGYAPLSAVAAPRRLLDPIAKGSGALLHAQTLSHHPVLAAAGLAAVRYIHRHGLVERCRRMGEVFHRKLAPLRELPHVGDIRGRGLLAGVEFVQDKGTRAPLPRKRKFAETFSEQALAAGLMTWANMGQADRVKVRKSYNVSAMSFCPAQIASTIKKHIPEFAITYAPGFRQAIADSWPKSIDDTAARKDWGWQHAFGLEEMTADILKNLQEQTP